MDATVMRTQQHSTRHHKTSRVQQPRKWFINQGRLLLRCSGIQQEWQRHQHPATQSRQ